MTERGTPAKRRGEERSERRRGVVAFGLALALATSGVAVAARGWQRMLVRSATVDGLALHLDQARWVEDQMDHDARYPTPPSMMGGLPVDGKHRLTVEVAVQNLAEEMRHYQADEFTLVAEDGEVVAATTELAVIAIAPGQMLNADVSFDLDTTTDHGALWVEWQRDRKTVRLPVPRPPKHEKRQAIDWPLLATQLPLGDAERGGGIFSRNGCAPCHGEMSVGDSNTVGPHLGTIARDGATRIAGKDAAQYIYESILDPSEFIAPACKGGHPCEAPSAMPEYSTLLRPQDMADLVAYLSRSAEELTASSKDKE